MAKKSNRKCDTLPILHPDAAGIDVGASELYVAVSADRDPHPLPCFPTFTRDLHGLADWLEQCGIHSVAMESTSVYWISIYQILEVRGLEGLSGQRTAREERAGPEDRRLRLPVAPVSALGWTAPCQFSATWRHRSSLIQMAAEHVLHMQKALDEMNLQIHPFLTTSLESSLLLRLFEARPVGA